MKILLLSFSVFFSAHLFASDGATSSATPVDTETKPLSQGASAQQTRSITLVNYEINDVKQWNPGLIMAKKGEKVTLKLINKALAVHGFYIPAFGIKENVQKDETKEVSFVADKEGLFDMKCHLHPAHVGGQLYILP